MKSASWTRWYKKTLKIDWVNLRIVPEGVIFTFKDGDVLLVPHIERNGERLSA